MFCWWLSLYDKTKKWPILFLVFATLLHDIFGIFAIILTFISSSILILKKQVKSDYAIEFKPIFLCATFYIFFRITSLVFLILTNDGVLIVKSYWKRLYLFLNEFSNLIQIGVYSLTLILISFLIFFLIKVKNINKGLIVLFLTLLLLGPIILILGKFYVNFISVTWLHAINNFASEFSKKLSFNLIDFSIIFYLTIIVMIISFFIILTKRKTDEIIFLLSPIYLVYYFY